MEKKDFEIVNDNGDVTIVRIKSLDEKKRIQPAQRMKVMCFDSAQIDRIVKLQEQSRKSYQWNKLFGE